LRELQPVCRMAANVCDPFDRNPSEFEARAAVLKENDEKMSRYKRVVKGDKSAKSTGLISCLSAH
jgi:hypothetical protein